MTAGSERAQCIISKSPEELNARLKKYILDIVTPLLKQNGLVSIGVSGGSMIKLLSEVFDQLARGHKLDWQRIRLFMVDERLVPSTDKESNHGQYIARLPERIKDCVIPVEICDSPMRSAQTYEMHLRQKLQPEFIGKLPRFDIVFLGMGPDGHTASLFPDHKLLKADILPWVVCLEDSPKPPPQRVTLNLHCINVAKNVAFIITGTGKAEVVKSVLERDTRYPSSLVLPMNNRLQFFLDEESSSLIDFNQEDT